MRDAKTTYNIALSYLKNTEGGEELPAGKMQHELHKLFITKEALTGTKYESLLSTPKEIRYFAIKSLVAAFTTNRMKNKTRSKRGLRTLTFEVKFKQSSTQITIPSSATTIHQLPEGSVLEMYKTLGIRGLLSEIVTWELKDMQLSYDGSFWICIPFIRNVSSTTMLSNDRMESVALDPGCRVFQTGYSADGAAVQIGRGMEKLLKPLLWKKRKKQQLKRTLKRNKTDKKTFRRKIRRINQRLRKLQGRISGITDNLHWKACHALCSTFENILIPRFNVKSIVKNKPGGKTISQLTKSTIYALKHFQFRKRLLQKASEYPGTQVLTFTEEFTSKTCGLCGKENKTLGSSEVFKCGSCLVEFNRDLHAARNMYLKVWS
jgi:transposase